MPNDYEGSHNFLHTESDYDEYNTPLIQCDICGDDIQDGEIAYLIEGQVYCSHCIEEFEFFANSKRSPEESHYLWQEYRKEQARKRREELIVQINPNEQKKK